jgi:hypothetical protein
MKPIATSAVLCFFLLGGSVPACDSGDGDSDCDCDPDRCQACYEGACYSMCETDISYCQHGECVGPGNCDPPCDHSACETCDEWSCMSTCGEGSVCDGDGHCVPAENCDPVADTGCPEGEHCLTFLHSGTELLWGCFEPSAEPAYPGEPCVTYGHPHDNCLGGAMCLSDRDGAAWCVKLCRAGDASACAGAYPDGEGGFVDGLCDLSLDVGETDIWGCSLPE